jgi:hypothetical protein
MLRQHLELQPALNGHFGALALVARALFYGNTNTYGGATLLLRMVQNAEHEHLAALHAIEDAVQVFRLDHHMDIAFISAPAELGSDSKRAIVSRMLATTFSAPRGLHSAK